MTITLDQRPALALTPLDRARPATGSPTTEPTIDPTTDTAPTTGSARLAAWERNGNRRDRLTLALSELFGTRDDLDGVSLVADVLAEDLLWSA